LRCLIEDYEIERAKRGRQLLQRSRLRPA
jgi:hypothetical protein